MNREINEIKNKVYEFEGLLELLALREDKAGELMPLLSSRIAEINAAFEKISLSDRSDRSDMSDRSDRSDMSDMSDRSDRVVRDLPRLCLNDRFRFRRDIFGGDDAGMRAALERIAGCRSLYEAEDYLYDELNADPESPAVEDFIVIIKEYFK